MCARALDTLAKALSPGDGPANESLEATMQLVSGDQSGSILELEGPLLSDSHVPFKVRQRGQDKNGAFVDFGVRDEIWGGGGGVVVEM